MKIDAIELIREQLSFPGNSISSHLARTPSGKNANGTKKPRWSRRQSGCPLYAPDHQERGLCPARLD
jgi:hypothetical protein